MTLFSPLLSGFAHLIEKENGRTVPLSQEKEGAEKKVVKTFPSKNSSRCVYIKLFEICTKNTSSKLGDRENCKCFPQTHTQTPHGRFFPHLIKIVIISAAGALQFVIENYNSKSPRYFP